MSNGAKWLIIGLVSSYLAIIVVVFTADYLNRKDLNNRLTTGCHLTYGDRVDDITRLKADNESKILAIKANTIVAHDPGQPRTTRLARKEQVKGDQRLLAVNRGIVARKEQRLRQTCEQRYPAPRFFQFG